MKAKKSVWAIVCALVLCVLCGVGLTVAKYVTSDNGSDNATVAKFGVEVSVDATNVFSTQYQNNSAVVVKGATDVVAPGTSGKLATIEISGTPEVNVEVAYTVTVAFTGWTLEDDSEYMPLVITVGDETLDTETTTTTVTKQYAAGTTLADITDAVTWEWAFSGNDANDTYLANKATLPTVSITVTASVTQINTGVNAGV